jgi:hypothetical protein
MDSRWYIFAETCRRSFDLCAFKSELVAECGGNDDIAWATFFHLRQDSLEWLHRKVPALDEQVPFQLIAAGQTDRVRDCLWCMPC